MCNQVLAIHYFDIASKPVRLLHNSSLPDNLVFFQNGEIFVQLDELDELDRIANA